MPPSGRVLMAGQRVHHRAVRELALQRAVLAQDTTVAFDFTVQEVVEMGRYPHRHAPSPHEARIVREAMQATGVAHLAGRSVNTLSGGERARTHLARALAQVWEPRPDGTARWLLLDEPTAALDLAHQHHAMQLVRRWALEQGVGVVAVLHDLNLALRYADDVLLLAAQGGVAGPVDDILTPDAVARIWQVQCTPVRSADGVRQLLMTASTLAAAA